jgi:DNA-3-methyladenine glycosylase
MKKLNKSFFKNEDVVKTAKDLLGKKIITKSKDGITSGIIIETESYAGTTDRASHAYGGRFTPRTKTMYEDGGIIYVYMCYGMHCLLNIVTNKKDIPHAVLIRAIHPIDGINIMLKRRVKTKASKTLTSGPGSLSKALGITMQDNNHSLLKDRIWIEKTDIVIDEDQIIASPRIGIDYAKEDKHLPWRFQIKLLQRQLN